MRTSIRVVMLPAVLLPLATWAAVSVIFDPDVSLGGAPRSNNVVLREVSLAANPADPLNLVAGFPDDFPRARDPNCRSVFSRDGGRTWNAGAAVPVPGRGRKPHCADPGLAADLTGNVFYAYLLVNQVTFDSDILVARSQDAGATWPAVSVAVDADPAVELPDKPFLAADASPGSVFQGRLYLSYTRILGAGSEIAVVASHDGGATWDAPRGVSGVVPFPQEEVSGSLPVVAPGGAVYVFYAHYRPGMASLDVEFSRSDDGGATWSAPADVASGLRSTGSFRLKNADPGFGSVAETGLIGNGFPSAATAPDGTLHVAWTDFAQGACMEFGGPRPACSNADVRLSSSRDGGQSWSVPVRVNDDATLSDQFHPWIAAHPDGLISLVWLDRRRDPLNVDYDVFYTNTADGQMFLPGAKVNSAPSLLGTEARIGEYPGLVASPGGVVAAWPDFRVPGSPAVSAARGSLGP